jgi:hypothetical protein
LCHFLYICALVLLLLLADVFLEARTAGALFCGLAAGCCCLSWKTSRANKAQRLEAAAWVAHAALEVAVDFGLGNFFLGASSESW